MGTMDDYDIKWKNHSFETVEVVKRLRGHDAFKDVWLYCETDGKTVPANKTILAACSAFFERVFVEIQVDERIRSPVIVLRQVQSKLLERALDFMFTGQVMIPSDELAAFVQLAESLEIRGLQGAPASCNDDVVDDAAEEASMMTTQPIDGDLDDVNHNFTSNAGTSRPKQKRRPVVKTNSLPNPKKKKVAPVPVVEEVQGDVNLVTKGDPGDVKPEVDAVEAEMDDVIDDGMAEEDPNFVLTTDTPLNIPSDIDADEPVTRKVGYMWRGKRNGATVFFCELCWHVSTKSTHAEDHNRVHTGEKPFKCRICDRPFSQKSHKNKHEATIHKLEKE